MLLQALNQPVAKSVVRAVHSVIYLVISQLPLRDNRRHCGLTTSKAVDLCGQRNQKKEKNHRLIHHTVPRLNRVALRVRYRFSKHSNAQPPFEVSSLKTTRLISITDGEPIIILCHLRVSVSLSLDPIFDLRASFSNAVHRKAGVSAGSGLTQWTDGWLAVSRSARCFRLDDVFINVSFGIT